MDDLIERLRASCENGIQPDDVYEAADELDRLRRELAEARQHIHKLIDLTEFWINREDRRDMSEQEYRTWMSLGFQSNAYRNARFFLTAADRENNSHE